ncbi:MAG TPA: hypothetical protein DEQ32_13855, partial [Gammaproteobacteria bacterium]|nr:hypothetical protein [Gammaproteobacteria bacterium]
MNLTFATESLDRGCELYRQKLGNANRYKSPIRVMFRIFTGFFLNGPNLSAIKHSDWIGLPHFLDTPHPSIELSELRITEW